MTSIQLGCGSESESISQNLRIEVVQNPYENTQLVAVLKISKDDLNQEQVNAIEITLADIDEQRPGYVETVDPSSTEFQTNFNMDDILESNQVGVPILGLYSGTNNEVHLRIHTTSKIYEGRVTILTEHLTSLEEEIVSVELLNPGSMEPGWTSADERVYDHLGNLRWLGPHIHYILKNGNVLTDTYIKETNLLGRIVNDRSQHLPAHFEAHHDAVELPSGNLLVGINNGLSYIVTPGSNGYTGSMEDHIVELDSETSEIVNVWDLRAFFDVSRKTVADEIKDWLHMNTVLYDEIDDSITISTRYQGIAKLTRNGIQGDEPNKDKELVWLFSPHLDFGQAGFDGQGEIDPNDYLLTAVDSDGTPYSDDVQNNLAKPAEGLDDFHWPMGQHGLHIVSRDDEKIRLLTFNNQASVIFDGPGSIDNLLYGNLENDRTTEPYSLIVEYEIDETAKTVRQVWSYGENLPQYYCSYKSGVNLLSGTRNRLMASCGVDRTSPLNNPYNSHIVEVTEQKEVVFHLEIENTVISLYRSVRINLYHPEQSIQ